MWLRARSKSGREDHSGSVVFCVVRRVDRFLPGCLLFLFGDRPNKVTEVFNGQSVLCFIEVKFPAEHTVGRSFKYHGVCLRVAVQLPATPCFRRKSGLFVRERSLRAT